MIFYRKLNTFESIGLREELNNIIEEYEKQGQKLSIRT